MEPSNFDPERDLSHLERPLEGLHPQAPALTRDRMLFEAGRATGRDQGRNRWLTATATLAFLVVGLSGLLAREHTQRQSLERTLAARLSEHVPTVLADKPTPPGLVVAASKPPEASPYSYLALSRRAQSGRLDDWPTNSATLPSGGRAERRPAPLKVRDSAESLNL
ncbi:hypothetical protein EP7_002479 [Isosphaeraceae bacterium EP7]